MNKTQVKILNLREDLIFLLEETMGIIFQGGIVKIFTLRQGSTIVVMWE
jgi:hypothetical protein